MKWLWSRKDGGPESKVWAWGFESKALFSVLVLKFGEGSREAFHSHAFNCISWVLRGALLEFLGLRRTPGNLYHSGFRPIVTKRTTFHQVHGIGPATWVITFRGPWVVTWREWVNGKLVTLAHGRKVIS